MTAPLFTIVMPSFLGAYPTAAKDRDKKIFRAIDSVMNQSFQDFELVIVADGCQETFDLVNVNYNRDRVECYRIEKHPLFAGQPRNMGIFKGKGRYIVYLDIDDYWGVDHLKIIAPHLQDTPDWVWFSAWQFSRHKSNIDGQKYSWIMVEEDCDITKQYKHGTANICHRRDLNIYWKTPGYAHDYHFVRELMYHKNYKRIPTPQYYICHIPNRYDL